MKNAIPRDVKAAMRALASLHAKSEKAQEKLTPGTWQYTMLQGRLEALSIAMDLMSGTTCRAENLPRETIRTAARALADMAERAENARAAFQPGTSHFSLQENRSRALRVAETLLEERLG